MKTKLLPILSLAIILVSCAPPPTPMPVSTPTNTPRPTATFTPKPSATPAQPIASNTAPVYESAGSSNEQRALEHAELVWALSKIDDYELYGHIVGGWGSPGLSFQVTVRNGQVVDSRCQTHSGAPGNNECEAIFTVPAIFEQAQKWLLSGESEGTPPGHCFSAWYDTRYGVPIYIRYDCPGIVDETKEWSFVFFTDPP